MLCALSLSLGCNRGRSAAPPHSALESSAEVETSTTVVTQDQATDVEALLLAAQRALDAGRFEEAAGQFEFVVRGAQRPDERLRALLGWGTALDAAGHPEQASGIYERYVKEAPEGPRRDEVRVRQVRILTYLEQYAAAAAVAVQVRTQQAPLGQVAIFASLALDALSQGHDAEAELSVARGRSVVEAEMFDHLDPIPLDVAALYFALGETRRKRAEHITFDPLPPDFSAALEQRCQWMLDAQSAYSQAMRAQDAHWSAMSGVAVGKLYHDLHKELMIMPRPSAADNDQRRELFEGALRLRYSILLTKAASMLRATLALQNKDRAGGAWTSRAEQTLRDIETAEQEEQRALAQLPYTRAQLQQALDGLARRGNSSIPKK